MPRCRLAWHCLWLQACRGPDSKGCDSPSLIDASFLSLLCQVRFSATDFCTEHLSFFLGDFFLIWKVLFSSPAGFIFCRLEWRLHKTSSFKRDEPMKADIGRTACLLVPSHGRLNVREKVAWQALFLDHGLISCPSSSFVLDECVIQMSREL